MEWQEVAAALSNLTPPFPRAAAVEARGRWGEWGPLFVAEIERVADGGSIFRDEARKEFNGLFSFAVYLAAEKRDARAYRPLVRVCHCTAERADELFGDDVGSTLGRLLASVCDGDLAPLEALAEDAAAAMWCRYAALYAMAVRVVEGDASRDDRIAYLDAFCEREAQALRRGAGYDADGVDLLTWAAHTASEIGPAPLLPKIRAWLAEGLIDPSVAGLRSYERKAALPVADCLAEAAEDDDNRYITDGLALIAGWFCFEEEVPSAKAPPPLRMSDPVQHTGTVARDTPKVGRNDPCPCGSGKKYKKCCGNAP